MTFISEIVQGLMQFPTAVFFLGYCLFIGLMLISLLTGFMGDWHLPFDIDANIEIVEVDAGIDVASDSPSSLTILDLFFPQRLGKVPLLVALSIVFFIALIISLCYQDFLTQLPVLVFWPLSIVLLFGTLFISLHIASWGLKPFSKLLDNEKVFAVINYEGLVGIVKTAKVTEDSGEIVITEGGRENYINVFSFDETEPLQYGDRALVVSYDKEKERYLVIKA